MNQAPQETRDPSTAALRLKVMGVIAVTAFAVIIGRLWGVQIRQGAEFEEKSRNNFFQWRRLEHVRGEIMDREGRVLVTSRPSLDVYVIPAFFPPAKRMLRELGAVANMPQRAIDPIGDTLGKTAAERGPALLFARGLEQSQIAAMRRVQERLELPLDAVPILEVQPGEEAEYAAYLDPDVFPTTALVLRRVRDAVGLDDESFETLERRIQKATGLARYQEILVRRDVPPEVEGKLALQIELGELPGVVLEAGNARNYRYDAMAAHLLGYVNEISPKELEERREGGYRLGDQLGRAGVERSFEDELRGIDGRETIVVDSKGRSQGSDFAELLQRDVGVHEAPRPGNRVVLTIDLDLQQAAERAFDGRAGSVVALEVKTGRVLAMTSTPAFNPNRLVGYFDPREKARLDAMNEERPWRFRAIQDFFPPGSTFKIVTAMAAMKNKVTTPNEGIVCPGAFHLGKTRFRCWKEGGHGRVDLSDSLAKSCDVYYYTMGSRLGLNPIAEMGKSMGLGRASGIALAPESNGIMPDEAWYRRNLPEGYTLGAAVNASIGQGAVSTTPIQLAVAYAALANGGTVFEPQVVLRIDGIDGSSQEVLPKIKNQMDAPQEAFDRVREGLRRVVNEPYGTAYRRRLLDIQVAGKTGTAQVAKLGEKRIKAADLPWKLRDNAWFAAFAPAEDPQIVVVVFNEHGGGGSSTAAPIAMRVIDSWHKKRIAAADNGLGEKLELAVISDDESQAEGQ